MYIDLDAASPSQAYFHIIQTLVPRPIAWVLSEHPNGSYNLAPFSYFTAVSSDPPLLMLSIGRKPNGTPKDTLANIMQRGHFVVHIAHTDLLEPLNASAATLAADESEVTQLDLPTTEFAGFALPRLTHCRVAFACGLYEIQQIGNRNQALVFGQIHSVFIDDAVAHQGPQGRIKVDNGQLDPLARLGANEYLSHGKVVRLTRPK